VLIWINGAFGAGKTQTAHELHRRLPNGHVADPELLGYALHKMLPPPQRSDFQDLPQWRGAVVATLQQIDATHDGPVIVPMSLVRDDYFDEIIGGLRGRGIEVRHYALTATPETLHKRLRQRSAYVLGRVLGRDETWAIQQIERCVATLAADRYASHVSTDDATIDEVVESIAHDAELTLTAPRLRPPHYQLRRLAVGVRHIRL
jgi:predicted kinase